MLSYEKYSCILVFLYIGICYVYAIDGNRVDSLLLKLDQAIKERPIYMEQKELRLAKLKKSVASVHIRGRAFCHS